MSHPLFTPRGEVSRGASLAVQLGGLVLFVSVWAALTIPEILPPSIPSPVEVVTAYPVLVEKAELPKNVSISVFLNFAAYLVAIVVCLVIGILVALLPFIRFLIKPYIDAARFVPLNACTGLFMLYFGIEFEMKIAFLSTGIIVYLLPLLVEKLDRVHPQLIDTARSLGASNIQIVFKVILPSALSSIFVDIRIIVAVSWTYITFAEWINRGEGGIGSVMYFAFRTGPEQMFALLFLIVLIGFIQDRIFSFLDRAFFPYKYSKIRSR